MKPIPDPVITILCGEASGDLYGGMLARSILAIAPNTRLQGIGGHSMEQAGVHILHPVSDLSVMGIGEVIRHIPKLLALRNHIVDRILSSGCSAVVLIDFPDFNLSVAKEIFQLKKRSNLQFPKIYYFVPPQIWIWRKNRIYNIKKFCDAVFPLFSFEHERYTSRGLKSYYFGHPVADTILLGQYYEKPSENQVSNTAIGLFPGSRLQEIRKILPVMIESVSTFCKLSGSEAGRVSILISRCNWIPESVYTGLLQNSEQTARLVTNAHEIMAGSQMILSKSGTVNLEIALFKKPFVVIYKTSWLTWIVAKLMLGIRHISLVNILSHKEVVKEFIQHKARPENIAAEMHRLCTDKKYTDHMISELNHFTECHIPNNSSLVTDQIARVILNGIKKSDDR